MILQGERQGKLLGKIEVAEGGEINRNSVLIHELAVRVPLYDGESVFATYGNKDLITQKFTPTTRAVVLKPRSYDADGVEKTEYFELIPNDVVKSAGVKHVSIAVMTPITADPADGYRQITSGIVSFSVGESLAGIGYDAIEESDVANLQGQINSLHGDMNQTFLNAQNAEASAREAQRISEEVEADNGEFKRDLNLRLDNHTADVLNRQAGFETVQTARQQGYEQELSGRQESYELGISARVTAAESVAGEAKATADGISDRVQEAQDHSMEAVSTANEAMEKADDAIRGNGTIISKDGAMISSANIGTGANDILSGATGYSPANKPTAGDIGAVSEYRRSIDMMALDENTYYPVAFTKFLDGNNIGRFCVTRMAHQDKEPGSTDTTRPGTLIDIECRPSVWGMYPTYFRMRHHWCHAEDRQSLGKVRIHSECGELVLYLRGGFTYNFLGNNLNPSFSILVCTEERIFGSSGAFKVAPVAAGNSGVDFGTFETYDQDITITKEEYKILGHDNTLHENGARVYSPNNKPTAADVGAMSANGNTSTTGEITADGFHVKYDGGGGWARGFDVVRKNAALCGFGAHGTEDNFLYAYVGKSYNNPNNLRILPSGIIQVGADAIVDNQRHLLDAGQRVYSANNPNVKLNGTATTVNFVLDASGTLNITTG